MPNCYPLLIRPPQTHNTRSVKTNCALLTSVSNLVKKTPNRDCGHISISHVIRAQLHTTCNDPTLQLNEHPVIDGHCTMMLHVSRGTTGPAAIDRSGGEYGKLGEGSEAVNASGQAQF